jgi:thiazolylpeptide-type bacteriocin precursor
MPLSKLFANGAFMQSQEISFDLSIESLQIEELKMSDFVTDSAEGETVSKVMSASCTTCVCTCSCIVPV